MKHKIILAYSGGLDTSVILKWLILKGYEVIAYVADVGQQEDFSQVKEKALGLGASKVIIEDLKTDFVEAFIFPALKAGASYEKRYLLGTALARPLIAKKLVEVAAFEGADSIAHGATGKGNDQIRFELSIKGLNPTIQIIAPWRDPDFLGQFSGREDLSAFAKKYQIPLPGGKKKPYSVDANLMHISYEGKQLEDPGIAPKKDLYSWTNSVLEAPDSPCQLTICFEGGVPVKVKTAGGALVGGLPIFEQLNEWGATHGIGRIDIVENRFLGIKSRGCYESPGATILWQAHLDLECLTLDGQVFHLKQQFGQKIGELIYNGLWFSPELKFLMAAIEQSQTEVTGEVDLLLYKGNVVVSARRSKNSRYDQALASMDESAKYDQQDATGFINCMSLRLSLS